MTVAFWWAVCGYYGQSVPFGAHMSMSIGHLPKNSSAGPPGIHVFSLTATGNWLSKVVIPTYILLLVKRHSSFSTTQPTLGTFHFLIAAILIRGIQLISDLLSNLDFPVAVRYSTLLGNSTESLWRTISAQWYDLQITTLTPKAWKSNEASV